MKRRTRSWARGLLLGFVGGFYAAWIHRANLRTPRLVLRRPDGSPYPVRRASLEDGQTVEYLDVGEGPTLILLPGFAGDKEIFAAQIPYFSRRFRVIAVDLRERLPAHTLPSAEPYAADLAHLLVHWRVEEPCLILGQSMGGMIALQFALDHPGRVRGLILCNPLAHWDFAHVWSLAGFPALLLAAASTRAVPPSLGRAMARWLSARNAGLYENSPGREIAIEYVQRSTRRMSWRAIWERAWAIVSTDLRARLGEISAPVLVLRGRLDTMTGRDWAREIAEGVRDGTYREIPGSGHLGLLTRPDLYHAAVEEWLTRLIA